MQVCRIAMATYANDPCSPKVQWGPSETFEALQALVQSTRKELELGPMVVHLALTFRFTVMSVCEYDLHFPAQKTPIALSCMPSLTQNSFSAGWGRNRPDSEYVKIEYRDSTYLGKKGRAKENCTIALNGLLASSPPVNDVCFHNIILKAQVQGETGSTTEYSVQSG